VRGVSASGQIARVRAALTPAEWRRAALLFAVILALHVGGFVVLLALVVPQHLSLGTQGVFGLGIGITAYTLGLRHAFDADHIAAIDNTTRKLLADGDRPLAVGFFFSLGHSTIVFVLAVLLAAGFRALGGEVQDAGSGLQETTGLVGTTISGAFLYVIAGLNLVILCGVLRVFRRMRHGDVDEAQLEAQLNARGALNRLFGRFTRTVRRSWQMYPIGLLFGLGFDTATEIALLVLAAGAGLGGLPFYAVLCLPVLFAAGMSLVDTLDGMFMNFAYGWAFAKPVRTVYYNIAVTGLSVAVALIIGTIELVSIMHEQLGLSGGVWDAVAGVDLNAVGYMIVGLFVVTWAIAGAVWRIARIEERWAPAVKRS
jgi:high-affinity nickel-transport protein